MLEKASNDLGQNLPSEDPEEGWKSCRPETQTHNSCLIEKSVGLESEQSTANGASCSDKTSSTRVASPRSPVSSTASDAVSKGLGLSDESRSKDDITKKTSPPTSRYHVVVPIRSKFCKDSVPMGSTEISRIDRGTSAISNHDRGAIDQNRAGRTSKKTLKQLERRAAIVNLHAAVKQRRRGRGRT